MKEESNDNNLGLEEEKKESSPMRAARTELEIWQEGLLLEKNESSPSPLNALHEGLPKELKGIVFKDEGELWKEQEKIGLSDLDIVLNSEGYAVWREMPGEIHVRGVNVIQSEFFKWKQEQGAVFFATKEPNVFVSDSFGRDRRNKKRCPDFAIWGPDRVDQDGDDSLFDVRLGKSMNPHAIFQFSWGNGIEKEKCAVDDMSMYAGTEDLAPLGLPKMLYLIKVARKGGSSAQPDSPAYGFDVYKVHQGARTADVPTFTYRVGRDEDVTIEVKPQFMGLPQDANSFLVSLAKIRARMAISGVVFEAENHDE